jgi:hypothetical protein
LLCFCRAILFFSASPAVGPAFTSPLAIVSCRCMLFGDVNLCLIFIVFLCGLPGRGGRAV